MHCRRDFWLGKTKNQVLITWNWNNTETVSVKKHLNDIAELSPKLIAKRNISRKCLRENHPQAKPTWEEFIITGDPPLIHPVILEEIEGEMVKRSAFKMNTA